MFRFINYFFKSYFFKNLQPDIEYKFPKFKNYYFSKNLKTYILLFLIIFYNVPKKSAFLYIYNFGKNLQNKFKLNRTTNYFIFFIKTFIFFIFRLLFLFLTFYNIKVVKFSLQFIDGLEKKSNNYNKNQTYNIFVQLILVDFFLIFDSYLTNAVSYKKIIFRQNGVEFNSPKSHINSTKD